MEISMLVIRVIILVIPGIITSKMYYSLIGDRVKKDWEDIFEMIFISIICYLTLSFFSQ